MLSPTFSRTQLNDETGAGVSNRFPFVNPKTAGFDCNVATTSQCIELVTGDRLTAKEIRNIADDHEGGTSVLLTVAAFKSVGMVLGEDYVRFSHRDVQYLRDLLAGGWFVVGFVEYGSMIDNAPQHVGSLTYRDGHAIGMSGWFRSGGRRMTWYYDPTCDGRTRTVDGRKHQYPFGRQKVRFGLIRDAMNAYNDGKPDFPTASGYAVKPLK